MSNCPDCVFYYHIEESMDSDEMEMCFQKHWINKDPQENPTDYSFFQNCEYFATPEEKEEPPAQRLARAFYGLPLQARHDVMVVVGLFEAGPARPPHEPCWGEAIAKLKGNEELMSRFTEVVFRTAQEKKDA